MPVSAAELPEKDPELANLFPTHGPGWYAFYANAPGLDPMCSWCGALAELVDAKREAAPFIVEGYETEVSECDAPARIEATWRGAHAFPRGYVDIKETPAMALSDDWGLAFSNVRAVLVDIGEDDARRQNAFLDAVDTYAAAAPRLDLLKTGAFYSIACGAAELACPLGDEERAFLLDVAAALCKPGAEG